MRFVLTGDIVANPLPPAQSAREAHAALEWHKNAWFNDNLRHPLQVIYEEKCIPCALRLAQAVGSIESLIDIYTR